MRKLIYLSFLLVLIFSWSGCGDSTHKFAPTSQLAFVRTASGGGMAVAMRHSIEMGGPRAQAMARKSVGAGLKPYLIASGSDSIVLMNNDGTGEAVVTDQGGTFYAVQLSLDGKKGVGIAEDENYNQQVFIADMSNLSNSNPLQLTTDSEDHYVPQISPDNKTVIFVKYDSDGNERAYTVPASGGAETLIPTPASVGVWTPSYTPDGKNIVFEEEVNDTINIMNTDGTGIKVLTNADGAYLDEYPSVSPDGKTVVFSRYGGELAGEEIFKANIDGTGLKQLTTTGTTGDSWDPQFVNNKIVFVLESYATHTGDIYNMNFDGTGVKDISNNAADEFFEYY